MGLHCWSISYCDYHRTDGFVGNGVWPAKAGWRAAVKQLVTARLWEPVLGGYRVHDYLDYNRSRAAIESLETTRRAAGQNGGLAKAKAKALALATANGQQTASNLLSNLPPPVSRIPDLTSSSVSLPVSGSARARARPTDDDGFANLPDEVRARLGQPPLRPAAS